MKSINALSLAPCAGAWLANSGHARVLHVFDRSCNLIDDRGEVLSIVTGRIGDGPFNLVVDGDVVLSECIDVRSPVALRAGRLEVGRLSVGIAGARRWSPRPDWAGLHARVDDLLDPVRALSLKYGAPQLPTPALGELSNSLAAADVIAGPDAARRLAGLGNGLTPAGDDFILGALLAARIVHPADVAARLAGEIANAAAPMTTSLSAAWIRAAGRGEAGILWHRLFQALLSGGAKAAREPVEALLAVGVTSGADALAGFVSIFVAFAESSRNPCPS